MLCFSIVLDSGRLASSLFAERLLLLGQRSLLVINKRSFYLLANVQEARSYRKGARAPFVLPGAGLSPGFPFGEKCITIPTVRDGRFAHFLFVEKAMDVRLLLENTLPGLGYELVDFELTPGGGFRVFLDKPGGITVEDCVLVSNHLTRLFMVENIDYERLEVSSPGLDRPLKKESDFVRFSGQRAKIKTRMPIEQQKKFSGRLAGVVDGAVQLEFEGRTVAIPLAVIDKARLDPEF